MKTTTRYRLGFLVCAGIVAGVITHLAVNMVIYGWNTTAERIPIVMGEHAKKAQKNLQIRGTKNLKVRLDFEREEEARRKRLSNALFDQYGTRDIRKINQEIWPCIIGE